MISRADLLPISQTAPRSDALMTIFIISVTCMIQRVALKKDLISYFHGEQVENLKYVM